MAGAGWAKSIEIETQQTGFYQSDEFSQGGISKKFLAIPCAIYAFLVSIWRRSPTANAIY
jgi:hypothetical protein